MKKIITLMMIVTLVTFYLTACKKSDTQKPPQTTLQKIQAKWSLETYLENDHYSGADHIRNSSGSANDYLDFRTDGKVYSSVLGYQDTATYSLSGDTKIIIDGTDTWDIKNILPNAFIIYKKDMSGADYYEETITMKK